MASFKVVMRMRGLLCISRACVVLMFLELRQKKTNKIYGVNANIIYIHKAAKGLTALFTKPLDSRFPAWYYS